MIRFEAFKLRAVQAVVAAAVLWSVGAQAHHSFALYDPGKLVDLSGTVHDWSWANPHCYLVLDVVKADGTAERWTLAGSSPNMVSRWGWNAADISIGDKLHVDVHPARDGRHMGQLEAVFLTSGKVLMDPAGKSGEELANGPTSTPTKPQGVPYR